MFDGVRFKLVFRVFSRCATTTIYFACLVSVSDLTSRLFGLYIFISLLLLCKLPGEDLACCSACTYFYSCQRFKFSVDIT